MYLLEVFITIRGIIFKMVYFDKIKIFISAVNDFQCGFMKQFFQFILRSFKLEL